MSDLVVLVPSRGRPEAARTLVQAFKATCTADTFLSFVVDADDPSRAEYESAADGVRVGVMVTASHTMVEALNLAAAQIFDLPPFAVGFMGDDHMPRTVGWDSAYLDALRELGTGMVFGDDLIQHQNLPTQIAMTADIVRALGYMAPPELTHLCVDNFWLRLGNGLGRLRYLPDVVVEHRHPVAGTAAMDEGYARVNAITMYERDAAAFDTYLRERFDEDFAKIRAVAG
jgi:hypothetical protein